MPIDWIGKWAVDGEDKLLKIPSGFIRDHATSAEIEFYKEILRLRRLLSEERGLVDRVDMILALDPPDEKQRTD